MGPGPALIVLTPLFACERAEAACERMGIDSKNLVVPDAFLSHSEITLTRQFMYNSHSASGSSEMMSLLLLVMNTALQWCLQASVT